MIDRTRRSVVVATCVALASCFTDTPGGDSPDDSTGATATSTSPGATEPPADSTSMVGASDDTGGPGVTSTPVTSSETGAEAGSENGSSSGGVNEPCDPKLEFGAPELVMELNSETNDDFAWLSDDELIVYVSSNRDGAGYDIFTAARDVRDEPFGDLVPLAGGDNAEDRRPVLTDDRLTMFAAVSPVGAMSYDIAVATRRSPIAAFSSFAPVAGVNSEAIDRAPWIDDEGTLLYFESNRDGQLDIYRSALLPSKTFEPPMPVGELNSPSEDGAPVLQDGQLVIYFASNRPGGVGDYDVWMATRSDVTNGFGMPVNVPEVSSPQLDWPAWVSEDGCRLYLGSRRPDGGDYDLWLAERG